MLPTNKNIIVIKCLISLGGSVIEHNIFQTHETTSGIYRENNTLSTCSSTPFKSKNNGDYQPNSSFMLNE